jgi:hypothetical protein
VLDRSAALSGAEIMKTITPAGWFWITYLTVLTIGVAAAIWL